MNEKKSLGQFVRVRKLFGLKGELAEGAPLFDLIDDEGYEEYMNIRWEICPVPNKFEYFITLRREINPKTKLCDVLSFSSLTVVSGKVKGIIEEYSDNCIFYPVRWQDEKGNYIDVEYYMLICLTYPGGELPEGIGWGQSYTGRPYNRHCGFSAQMVGDLHTFRGILEDEAVFVSQEIHDRLVAEKCKFIDFKKSAAYDVEWDVSEWLGPWLNWIEERPEEMRRYATRYRIWVSQHRPHWLDV